jgi:hypothetical protein
MVDVVGATLVQAAKRVVRQGGQVNHGVESLQIRRLNVAHVFANRGYTHTLITERAGFVKIRIQSDDAVSGANQYAHHHRADVSVVSRHEYPHLVLLIDGELRGLEQGAGQLRSSACTP